METAPYRPRRILVTGARGFVGSFLCAALAERWPEADVFPVATQAEASPGFIVADMLDRAAMHAAVEKTRPDVIVHLAGQASVARGSQDGRETWEVNVSGTLNLALAATSAAPEAILVFASSAEVYGASFLAGSAVETTPLLPMNAYARSKAIAERVLAEALPISTRLIIARPFNHTGPGQREDFVLPSFAAQVARIEAGLQPPSLKVGNIDVTRNFLDVRDVVAAYVALVEDAARLPHRFTCNIASEEVRPLRAHVEMLQELSNAKFDIVVDQARLRPVDLPIATGEARLLRALTGWKPRYDLRTTLEAMLQAARTAGAKSPPTTTHQT